jgi:hypothetical protein
MKEEAASAQNSEQRKKSKQILVELFRVVDILNNKSHKA